MLTVSFGIVMLATALLGACSSSTDVDVAAPVPSETAVTQADPAPTAAELEPAPTVVGVEPTPAAVQVQPTPTAEVQPASSEDGGREVQVLIVSSAIPRGTSVDELVSSPTVYLSSRSLPVEVVADSALTSIAELTELQGLVLGTEGQPGEQLLRTKFIDASDFDRNVGPPLTLEAPAGHEVMVLEVPTAGAVRGRIRAGDTATIIATDSLGADGDPNSVVVAENVEVLAVQAVLGNADPEDFAVAHSFAITLAVEPVELTALTEAATSEITLARTNAPAGFHLMAIDLSVAGALGGEVRGGDFVDVTTSPEGTTNPVEILARGVEVFLVSVDGMGQVGTVEDEFGDPSTGDFVVLIALPFDALLDVVNANSSGDIALAPA